MPIASRSAEAELVRLLADLCTAEALVHESKYRLAVGKGVAYAHLEDAEQIIRRVRGALDAPQE